MFNEFLKLHNKLTKQRSNEVLVLLENQQDVREGRMNPRVYEKSFPIQYDRVRYYAACLAGLEHGFFTYFSKTADIKISISVEGDMEYDEEFKEVISSRLSALARLAKTEETSVAIEEIEEYEYEGEGDHIVKAFIEYSQLGASIAQTMDLQKASKTYKKLRKKH